MLLAVAILGWLAALVAGYLLWRRSRPTPRAHQPVTTTGSLTLPVTDGPVAVLFAADGTLESVRQLKGAAPAVIHRPRGRQRATVYRYQGRDGNRVRYQAES